MTRDEWQRVKTIAESAWDLPDADRDEFVSRACEGDEELRCEVESLLRHAVEASDQYERPALAFPGAERAFDAALQPHLMPGTRVGPYRIVREIGRGGMGSVFLAHRADGEFEQQVAIKFVAGIPNAIVLRRFRDERRILAALDHPNIARLFDAGTTAEGLPYVVMEFIEGVSIAAFCDDRQLSTRARIELFRQVCTAVQYAHQRLVIHRDLKAGNILVTREGIPKLLDFGIATLIDPSAGSGPDAAPAATVLRALTPESASPEQVRGEPITVTADIYALGALLYRLVTGCSPYGSHVSSEAALLRAICDDTPLPPSAALASSGASPARDRLDRDLDLIVLKALRKEPDRRYQSVEQLSSDLQRYLAGQPVLAGPDSRRYRAAKFFRRHRLSIAAASVAMAAVLAGGTAASYQAYVASRERALAERRFEHLRKLSASFLFELHDAIADLPGSLNARQLVVKRAAQYLDILAGDARDDVALQRDLATANERLGTILGGGGVSNLGDLANAESRYQTARSIRETLAARADAAPADLEGLALLCVQLARFLSLKGDLASAEENAARAVALYRSLQARAGGPANIRGQLATALHQLGYVQARRGRNAASLASLEQAVESAKAQVEATPDNRDERARLARIQIDQVDQLVKAKEPAAALAAVREARAAYEALLASEPLNVRYRRGLSQILNFEGVCFEAMGDLPAAIRSTAAASAMTEALLAAAPEDHANQLGAMMNHLQLGTILTEAGQRDAGIGRFRDAIAGAESVLKATPGDDFTVNELAMARLSLGAALLEGGARRSEGCAEIAEARRLWTMLAARSGVPGESADDRGRADALLARCGF